MPPLDFNWAVWNWFLIPIIAVGYGIIATGWKYLTRKRRAKQHSNDEYYDSVTNRWY